VRILNETGSRVWELINGKDDIKKIAKNLCAEFEVNYQDMLLDTAEFLSCLKDYGMIELKDATR
jgi:hypothetical protein